MLVSRVACFGQIHHQQAGYSGPLSRHLLAYHCMISSVHACDRDLLEMTVTAMFLEGSVDRDRDDWTELGLRYYSQCFWWGRRMQLTLSKFTIL